LDNLFNNGLSPPVPSWTSPPSTSYFDESHLLDTPTLFFLTKVLDPFPPHMHYPFHIPPFSPWVSPRLRALRRGLFFLSTCSRTQHGSLLFFPNLSCSASASPSFDRALLGIECSRFPFLCYSIRQSGPPRALPRDRIIFFLICWDAVECFTLLLPRLPSPTCSHCCLSRVYFHCPLQQCHPLCLYPVMRQDPRLPLSDVVGRE